MDNIRYAGKINGRDSVQDGNKAYSGDELATMPHASLYEMREHTKDQASQDTIAKYEHRAFARELAKEDPLASLGLVALIPGYQAAKVAGTTKSRSQPSLAQAAQGFMGLGEGLASHLFGKK